MNNDPNKGSNFGWYALIVLVLIAFLLVFTLGPLCPKPDTWRNHKKTNDSSTDQ